MLLCPGCAAAVSEWAARCPACGRAVDTLTLSPPAPRARPAPRRRSLAAAVALASAALGYWGTGGHLAGGRDNAGGRVITAAGDAPALRQFIGPHDGVVVYADQGSLRVAPLDRMDAHSAPAATPGYPERPLVTSGAVVYVAGGSAYALFPPYGAGVTHRLGAANHVLRDLDPRRVWLVTDEGASSTARLTDLAGRDRSAPVRLPTGTEAFAAVEGGLLLHDRGQVLVVWDPQTGTVIRRFGPAVSVLDTHQSVVAWIEAGGALHLTDVRTGGDRVLPPPARSTGYQDGGAISPDGATLAAFVADSSARSGSSRLVLIDIGTGRTGRPVPQSDLDTAGASEMAVWSPTSNWLFFSGVNGLLKAYLPGDAGAVVVPEPASYVFAVS